jgi:hypothetical protein
MLRLGELPTIDLLFLRQSNPVLCVTETAGLNSDSLARLEHGNASLVPTGHHRGFGAVQADGKVCIRHSAQQPDFGQGPPAVWGTGLEGFNLECPPLLANVMFGAAQSAGPFPVGQGSQQFDFTRRPTPGWCRQTNAPAFTHGDNFPGSVSVQAPPRRRNFFLTLPMNERLPV